MEEWKPKLKSYPHFDRLLPVDEIHRIVKDPARVAKNGFLPFLVYVKKYKAFGGKDKSGNHIPRKTKERLIRYAARKDSYIFSYYRYLLSERYEERLKKLGITECPIAYRRIRTGSGKKGNKSNIHFAKESFQEILRRGPCYAIAFDISKYFEHIDHAKLCAKWCDVLGEEALPLDHANVFKNITQYAYVDRDACYEALGYRGTVNIRGRQKQGLLRPYKEIPIQMCDPKVFREIVCGKGKGQDYKNLTVKNRNTWGIPQGSPISDLLANIYLLDFDKAMQEYALKTGAYYRRYSDDILLITPHAEPAMRAAIDFIRAQIKLAGEMLEILPKKTQITEFFTENNVLKYKAIISAIDVPLKNKPFEYLGFSFNGTTALIRSGTLSRYYSKMTAGVQRVASKLAARYPDKDVKGLMKQINFSEISQKYGKVDDYDTHLTPRRNWTFWTYARRAAEEMDPVPNKIIGQLARRRRKLEKLIHDEVIKAYNKRSGNPRKQRVA